MKTLTAALSLFLVARIVVADGGTDTLGLPEVIAYGLRNNAKIRAAKAAVAAEAYGVRAAEAERLPRLDLTGGATRYRFPTPVTPLFGTPPANIRFPDFDTTIYDAGLSFTMPLYRGGRLDRNVAIAELRKSLAEDLYRMDRQELVFNLTSVYYKILQLEKILEANEETVKQLEAHRRDVELFYRTGTAAKVDLLKVETELAHAHQAALISRNNLESASELLKTLMGVDEMDRKLSLAGEPDGNEGYPPQEESLRRALEMRPDYQSLTKRLRISEERVASAQGKRLPALNLAGEYSERAGTDADFKPNWVVGLRLTVPLFEGGSIDADVGRARAELIQAKEEERALRLEIIRAVRDSYLHIENAAKRVGAAEKAIDAAKENLRIEQLRHKTGAGTSTDVIDAQAALLRAETDFYQARFDKAISRAALRKAVGEEVTVEETAQ